MGHGLCVNPPSFRLTLARTVSLRHQFIHEIVQKERCHSRKELELTLWMSEEILLQPDKEEELKPPTQSGT